MRRENNKSENKHSLWELYDLCNDISEKENVAGQNQPKMIELIKRWNMLNDQTKPSIF